MTDIVNPRRKLPPNRPTRADRLPTLKPHERVGALHDAIHDEPERWRVPLAVRSREAHEFADRLLTQQEPLGKEFEGVLHENLWDLYERG